jgi:hypothetical protein
MASLNFSVVAVVVLFGTYINICSFHELLHINSSGFSISISLRYMALFGWADKPAEKHCWLICCEKKILFRLKKQAEKDGL